MKKFIKENWIKIVIVIIVIVVVSILLESKFLVQHETQQGESPLAPTSTTEPESGNLSSQIANPASENCIKKGGKLSIVDKPEGQVGMCTLSDGTICEEWALFRGECQE